MLALAHDVRPVCAMSALPLKADICSALAHVCFGPIADITHRWSNSASNQLRFVDLGT
jgi:hypothetical protein